MKTLGGKLSFGIAAIASGQKASVVNAEPVLVANSTSGKFTITPAVSKALNIANGEYVQFASNLAEVEAAIANRNEDLVAYCAEQGLDIETVEGQNAIIKEFGQYYIGKGIQQFDAKGNPKMVSERYTKEDKEKYIKDNAAELLAANREALLARVGNPDATDEELIAAISVDDMESPKTESFSGSKASNVSGLTGIGVQLSFTDSSIWAQMKNDLGEEKTKINRTFKVLVDAPETILVNNGKDDVEVRVLPVEFESDSEPLQRGKKAE